MNAVVFRSILSLLVLSPGIASAQETETPFFAPLIIPVHQIFGDLNLWPWLPAGLAVIAIVSVLARRRRLSRRATRLGIAGLRNGPRFRVVDAMIHAVWRDRKIDETRLTRALEIARNTTEMDFSRAHLHEMALRADRLILPTTFRWMREGLTQPERMVVFNTTVSVLLADGPLTRSDRAFLRKVAWGVGLKRDDLRHLAYLVAT